MKNSDLQQLFARYLAGDASPEEVKLLLRQFDKSVSEAELRSVIRQQLESDAGTPEHIQRTWQPALEEAYRAVKAQIDNGEQADNGKEIKEDFTDRSGIRRRWLKYSAAAAIALLITSAIFILGHKKRAVPGTEAVQRQDIAPGGNKAILVLANGRKIILDSAKTGILSMQGNTKIIKQNNGLLTYDKSHTGNPKILFNTITTPKGGQYRVVLSDGTKVWLNAASSIHFPNEFRGKMREVRITGEAYFEVAEDAEMPFKVLVNDITIRVLGTHFNVMAYKNEPVAKITLLQGAVKVTEGNKNVSLKPGEQAQADRKGQLVKVKNVNVQGTIAWKNNQFWFNDDDIQTVMRKLSRWYNVNVDIKGDIPQHFGGYLSRNIYVSKIFEALQATSHLQYKIQDSTIIVSP